MPFVKEWSASESLLLNIMKTFCLLSDLNINCRVPYYIIVTQNMHIKVYLRAYYTPCEFVQKKEFQNV